MEVPIRLAGLLRVHDALEDAVMPAKLTPSVEQRVHATIVAHYRTHTLRQLAMMADVSKSSIVKHVRKLKAEGVILPKPSLIERQSRNPSTVPKSGVLLAKTCTGCGFMLSRDWFYWLKHAWTSKCRRCIVKRSAESTDWYQWAVKVAAENATRVHEPWTADEIEVLADPEKTILEKALELGRTFGATNTAVQKFGFAEHRPRLGDPASEAWVIRFEGVA